MFTSAAPSQIGKKIFAPATIVAVPPPIHRPTRRQIPSSTMPPTMMMTVRMSFLLERFPACRVLVLPALPSGTIPKAKPCSALEPKAERLGQDFEELVVVRDRVRRDRLAVVYRELSIPQHAASFGSGQLHRQGPHEARIRMRRGVVVSDLVVDRLLLLEGE